HLVGAKLRTGRAGLYRSTYPYVSSSELISDRPLPFFFFNDPATTQIYTLSLHDALPISPAFQSGTCAPGCQRQSDRSGRARLRRSEEHTSELQSRGHLVCRLLLEKKKSKETQAATYGAKIPDMHYLSRP